ncbi:MAG TPA: hypothetical protein VFV50_10640 [Bdellovibrionales bacterium]|nr:hypothetical protein [Bdellovibrionales bacterium]
MKLIAKLLLALMLLLPLAAVHAQTRDAAQAAVQAAKAAAKERRGRHQTELANRRGRPFASEGGNAFLLRNVWAVPKTNRLDTTALGEPLADLGSYLVYDIATARPGSISPVHDSVVYNETLSTLRIPSGEVHAQLTAPADAAVIANELGLDLLPQAPDSEFRAFKPRGAVNVLTALEMLRRDTRVRSADLDYLSQPVEPH